MHEDKCNLYIFHYLFCIICAAINLQLFIYYLLYVAMAAILELVFNYLLTYDSYVPLYNRFHRGEWITRVSGGPLNGTSEASAIWAQECPGPPPPHSPK